MPAVTGVTRVRCDRATKQQQQQQPPESTDFDLDFLLTFALVPFGHLKRSSPRVRYLDLEFRGDKEAGDLDWMM